MDELIRRSDAIEALYKYNFVTKEVIEREIMDIPSAGRPQGEWAHQRNAFGIMEHKCSVCGVSFTTMDTYNFKYCFNCGARMFAKDINVPNTKGADDEDN